MAFDDDEFVYEKRLKSEMDRWINEYDMLEARMLSKKADEEQKKEMDHLLKELKKDFHKAEEFLAHLKESSGKVVHNIEEEVEKIIKAVEQKIESLKKHKDND
jgi:signal recognition particle subunit SEC65